MRWVEHWIIGEDCLKGRRSLPYQLGCLLPDWIDRHPIHRREESLENFLELAVQTRSLPRGRRRDWQLGLMAHFLCDYCTEAHNEEYYNFYRHRVYEVRSQRRIQELRRKDRKALTRVEPLPIPEMLLRADSGDEIFREALRRFLNENLDRLRGEVRALDCERWYTDTRVMDLDIAWAHRLLGALLRIYRETDGE